MKIAVLDFNCNSVDIITVDESFIEEKYNGEIEADFLSFPAGTSKFDVWHWFDERCPNNLHDDLMY